MVCQRCEELKDVNYNHSICDSVHLSQGTLFGDKERRECERDFCSHCTVLLDRERNFFKKKKQRQQQQQQVKHLTGFKRRIIVSMYLHLHLGGL